MAEGLEAVGEAVTGGMAARVAEPAAGEPSGHDGTCRNCGTALKGDFCHACGQQGHVHRTLSAFGHDLLHSVLHFDGKFWRTLPLLVWRPGELTRRYIEGQRARFVSPMALFLFSLFLMFAIFSALGGPFGRIADSAGNATPQQERAEAQRDFDEERAKDLADLKALEAERSALVAAGDPTTEVDVRIRVARDELALKDRLFKQAIALIDVEEQREALRAQGTQGEARTGTLDANIGWPWLDEALEKAAENPSLLFYKLQANAYKFSWALIPISVPFLWLLFLHRRRYRAYKAYDHMVFVTYSIAFMSLALIALTMLRPLGLGDGLVLLAVTVIPPVHMYRQLRGAYALSRWSALWRTFALLIFALVAGGLFFVLLLTLGLLG